MKILTKILGVLLGTLLAAVAVAYLWLQDTRHLKQELEAWANANLDYSVSLEGQVQWRLFPQIYLKLEAATLQDADLQVNAGAIEVFVNPEALWDSPDEWRVDEVALSDTRIRSADQQGMLHLTDLRLRSMRYEHPIPTSAEFALHLPTPEDEEALQPITGAITAQIIYSPEHENSGQRAQIENLVLTSTAGNASCEADGRELLNAVSRQQTAEEILPLATLSAWDFSLQCGLTNIAYNQLTLAESEFSATNTAAVLDVFFNTPDVYGGSAQLTATVNYAAEPTWHVDATANRVLIERLLAGQSDPVKWQGPITLDGQFDMTGNTPGELQASVLGDVEFTSANGQIDVLRIKRQLQRLALLTNQTEEVDRWPDTWPYQLMQGRWRVNAAKQQLNVAIDNMSINGNGSYDIGNDNVDMLAEVTIHPPAADTEFSINPLLLDTPIPIRCRGPGADPKCSLDEKAGQSLLAQSLQKDSDTGVRRKLEEKIDEEVPEEYREVARDLLDLLGRALERD